MCATLCSLNRCILFSVFYVLPSGVINDDDCQLSSFILHFGFKVPIHAHFRQFEVEDTFRQIK